jgi:PAS domain S-box-containing protein
MTDPHRADELPRTAPGPAAEPDHRRLVRAELALQAAEDFNRAILDAVNAEVAVLDEAGTIVAVNRPWRQFALDNSATPGRPAPNTGIGVNYLEVCRAARGASADDAMTVHDGILGVLQGKSESFSFEYPCHSPERRRWFLLTATALGGAHRGAVVSHTDISAPMDLSERLKLAHERLALAQESAGAGVWSWDLRSAGLEWSDELFRLFGLDPLRTQPSFDAWRAVLHPEDAAAVERQILDAVESRQPLSAEYRILLSTGEIRWIHALGKTIHDPSGETVRMAGICLDVTPRKLTEQRFFATSQRLAALMDALPVGVSFSDDRECHHITGNPALLAQFEATPRDNVSASAPDPTAAGRRVRYLRDGRELDDAELPLQRAAREGIPVAPTEIEIHLPSGRRWFAEVSGAPLRDAQGRVIGGVAVVVDVTDRRWAEEALREADRRKDEFLAMLAHELRNPLTPIRNAVHIMGKIELPDRRLEWAREVIGQQVTHLARLVDDLLDVSRIVHGKITLRREVVDLATVVDRAVAAVRPAAEGRAQALRVQLPEPAVALDADPVRLTQVLVNLLENAVKFTPDGGRVEVAARCVGEEVEVQVRDNGCGIAAELLPHVFDPFQQGQAGIDRAGGGLGIGLTLAQRLTVLHGGRIEAASGGPGTGSTFTVRLPAGRPAAAPGPGLAAAPRPAASGRVLVVDDDAAVAASTTLWLELEGHEVRVARDGPAAIAEARGFRPHAVLLDIGLAGMDGYEVARRLRSLPGGSELLLVAVTGYGDEAAIGRSRAAGFDQHLVKPFDPRRLSDLLASHAQGRP